MLNNTQIDILTFLDRWLLTNIRACSMATNDMQVMLQLHVRAQFIHAIAKQHNTKARSAALILKNEDRCMNITMLQSLSTSP